MTFWQSLKSTSRKHVLSYGLYGLGFLIIVGGVVGLGGDGKTSSDDDNAEGQEETTSFQQSLTTQNPTQAKIENLKQDNEYLQNRLARMEETLKATNQSLIDMQKQHQAEKERQEKEQAQKKSSPSNNKSAQNGYNPFQNASATPQALSGMPNDMASRTIRVKKFDLKPQHQPEDDKKSQKKYIENYLPAGTLMQASLLSGVDAPTSVSGAANPEPVFLAVNDNGVLPGWFESRVKQCRIVGSSYADLSSERVKIRLEKLTCVEHETGEIVETQLSGYVTGEDGKAGVRGKLYDKSGQAMRYATLTGLTQGVSDYLNKNGIPNMTSNAAPSGGSPQSNSDIMALLKSSGQSGANSALEQVTKYYIQRAEQLQPVLQVGAGRNVDIILTEGSRLGETDLQNAITQKRNAARQKEAQKSAESNANPLLAPQSSHKNNPLKANDKGFSIYDAN